MRKLTWTRVAAAALILAASAGTAFAANNIAVPNGPGGQCANGNPNTTRFAGNCGALITLNDATTNPSYVQENNPSAETAYRVRLYVNLRGLTMPSGDEFDLFAAYDGADPAAGSSSGDAAVRVEVGSNGTDKNVLLAVRTDADTEVMTTPVTLYSGWHAIEFSWVRSTGPGNNNGSLSWWLDGVAQTGLSTIDNDTEVVNYARWGAVFGLEASTQGTFKADDYASQRSGYIGPALPFADVPTSGTGSNYWRYAQTMYSADAMPECAIGSFCRTSNVTRKAMARIVLLSRYGGSYVPPSCSLSPGVVFTDVACPGHPDADWIYDLRDKNITAGCSATEFCPDGLIARKDQMVFTYKAKGTVYTGGCGTGGNPTNNFTDVPTGAGYCPYVNKAFTDGLTAGCSVSPPQFCPLNNLNRGDIAVFSQKGFLPVNPELSLREIGP